MVGASAGSLILATPDPFPPRAADQALVGVHLELAKNTTILFKLLNNKLLNSRQFWIRMEGWLLGWNRLKFLGIAPSQESPP